MRPFDSGVSIMGGFALGNALAAYGLTGNIQALLAVIFLIVMLVFHFLNLIKG